MEHRHSDRVEQRVYHLARERVFVSKRPPQWRPLQIPQVGLVWSG